MKKYLLIILTLFLIFAPLVYAKHIHTEKWYQTRWAIQYGGIIEYPLTDGKRIDILTTDWAIEVDFASKFYEAVGQSLLYAKRTDRQPGIILIVEQDKDLKYIKNLQEIIDAWELPIRVWIIYEEQFNLTEEITYGASKEKESSQ